MSRPQVVFVLGGPGAGKGTQCAKIVENFGWCHLSAGDLLREERKSGSSDAELINTCEPIHFSPVDHFSLWDCFQEFLKNTYSDIKEGKIVPVEITVKLLLNAMMKSDNKKFLIDGFPRSVGNYEGWIHVVGDNADVLFCLFYECSEDELERRLLNRGQGRDDDNIESIRKRFKTFVEETMPVTKFFEETGRLRHISSAQSVEAVWEETKVLFAN